MTIEQYTSDGTPRRRWTAQHCFLPADIVLDNGPYHSIDVDAAGLIYLGAQAGQRMDIRHLSPHGAYLVPLPPSQNCEFHGPYLPGSLFTLGPDGTVYSFGEVGSYITHWVPRP